MTLQLSTNEAFAQTNTDTDITNFTLGLAAMRIVSAFESLAHSRRIRFSFSQNKTGQWAEFDRDKLEKVITNLLSNAFK